MLQEATLPPCSSTSQSESVAVRPTATVVWQSKDYTGQHQWLVAVGLHTALGIASVYRRERDVGFQPVSPLSATGLCRGKLTETGIQFSSYV